MGILNLTDNSFVEKSRVQGIDKALERVDELLRDGADIIDIGALSTAPGNGPIPVKEEEQRLLEPVMEIFSAFPDASFSIDCFHPGIVQKIIDFGKEFIINDILASDNMIELARSSGLKYIAMANVPEPYPFFRRLSRKMDGCDWILDPGFGFEKTFEQNWEIMNNLECFEEFGRPVLIGISRKRMIHLKFGLRPETCAEQSVAAEKQAAAKIKKVPVIIRTHDVRLHCTPESSLQNQ